MEIPETGPFADLYAVAREARNHVEGLQIAAMGIINDARRSDSAKQEDIRATAKDRLYFLGQLQRDFERYKEKVKERADKVTAVKPYRDSELDRLNAESAKVDTWRTMELQKQQAYLDLKVINDQKYADRAANINQQASERQARVEIAKNSAILSASSDFFGNMAVLSQSGNKKMAAIGKAAAIAQATISTYDSANKAYAALAGIPVIGPALGAAAAGAAIAAGLANVANIAGIGFSSGGYTGPGGVNEVAGTVHKGEVVWSQKDIQRYGGVAAVEALRNGNVSAIPSAANDGGTGGASRSGPSAVQPQINITINADGTSSVEASQGLEQRAYAIAKAVMTLRSFPM